MSTIHLDHIGHWVPDIARAGARLEHLGFHLTPFSEQVQADGPGGRPVPAGSGNRCVMLETGYLEVLTPLADTPIGRELRAGIDRHVGVHIAAFETDAPEREAERLAAAGFAMRPVVHLSRSIEVARGGHAEARFTVLRPTPGTLPEGRVQLLVHHTREILWQPRWIEHPNGARALTDLVFAVDDTRAAATRYAAYLDRAAVEVPGGHAIALDRGTLALLSPRAACEALGARSLPAPPCMAGYVVECPDRDRTRRFLLEARVRFEDRGEAGIAVAGGPDLGSALLFTGPEDRPAWRRAVGQT